MAQLAVALLQVAAWRGVAGGGVGHLAGAAAAASAPVSRNTCLPSLATLVAVEPQLPRCLFLTHRQCAGPKLSSPASHPSPAPAGPSVLGLLQCQSLLAGGGLGGCCCSGHRVGGFGVCRGGGENDSHREALESFRGALGTASNGLGASQHLCTLLGCVLYLGLLGGGAQAWLP